MVAWFTLQTIDSVGPSLGSLNDSVSKESAWNAGNTGSILGSRRSPRGGNGNLLQYSCLEKIPWTEESGGLQFKVLQRVGHD